MHGGWLLRHEDGDGDDSGGGGSGDSDGNGFVREIALNLKEYCGLLLFSCSDGTMCVLKLTDLSSRHIFPLDMSYSLYVINILIVFTS